MSPHPRDILVHAPTSGYADGLSEQHNGTSWHSKETAPTLLAYYLNQIPHQARRLEY